MEHLVVTNVKLKEMRVKSVIPFANYFFHLDNVDTICNYYLHLDYLIDA